MSSICTKKKKLVDCYIMLFANVLLEDEVVFTIVLFIWGPESLLLDQLQQFDFISGKFAAALYSPKVRKHNDSCALD